MNCLNDANPLENSEEPFMDLADARSIYRIFHTVKHNASVK